MDIARLTAAERGKRSVALAITSRIEYGHVPAVPVQGGGASCLERRRSFGKPVKQDRGPSRGERPRGGQPAASQSGSVGCSNLDGFTGTFRLDVFGTLVGKLPDDNRSRGSDQNPGRELDDRQEQTHDRPEHESHAANQRAACATLNWPVAAITLPGKGFCGFRSVVGTISGHILAGVQKSTGGDSIVRPRASESIPDARCGARESRVAREERGHRRPARPRVAG